MTFGLMVVVALLAGAFGAHFLMEDRGYVLVNFLGWSVETSVPVLLIILALAYMAVRALAWLWRLPHRLGSRAGRWRSERAGRRFTDGLIEYAEGNLKRGEKLLARSAAASDRPLLHYLTAARAAQLQGAYERRDRWLREAYESTPEAATAVLLTQAELQIAHRQHEEALATLSQIAERHPNHPQALTLMARLHEQRGAWAELADLLPKLRRTSTLDETELDRMTVYALTRLLADPALDEETLDRAWEALPRRLRQHPKLLVARTRALAQLQLHTRCEQEVRQALSGGHWLAELVLLYGDLHTGDDAELMRQVEQWLRTRPEDPELLYTAGRLAIRNEVWGKARSYLETSLDLKPRADTYQVYGRLMAHLGHPDAAAEAFRQGLGLIADDDIGWPALRAPTDDRTDGRDEPRGA